MGEGPLSSWTLCSHPIRLISCEQLMGMQCADFLLSLGGNWICPNGPDQGLRMISCQLQPNITCSELLISTILGTLSHQGQLCLLYPGSQDCPSSPPEPLCPGITLSVGSLCLTCQWCSLSAPVHIPTAHSPVSSLLCAWVTTAAVSLHLTSITLPPAQMTA